MAKKNGGGGRFEKSYNDKSIGEGIIDGIIETMSFGLIGTDKCDMIDRKTGEKHTGYGTSNRSAKENAQSKFKK